MRFNILASVCVASLFLAAPAMAEGVSATLGGGYGSVVGGGSGTVWNLNGSAMGHLDQDWGVEGLAGYAHSAPGNSDAFNFGGSLFTGLNFGRASATVAYSGQGPIHAVQYGIGGDWFAADNFTLSLRGGGLSATASGSSYDGGYYGGQATWYVMPDLAFSGAVDYLTVSTRHITTENLKIEWLFSDSIPLSIYGGYQHSSSTGSDADALFVGLKFYFDGAPNLVGHQRTGSLGYIAQGVSF